MIDLKTLTIFVQVAEQRSFARAAQKLGITQWGVSNAVSRLEDQIGVRLLARTIRRVNLTEDGAAFLDRCRRILADLEEAERVLGRASVTPVGRLRVDLPVSFGRLKVVPLLGAFRQKYPELMLALSFTDRYVDLIEEGVDVAVRIGPLQDSSLIARRMTLTRFQVYGAPAYFARYRRPGTPEDLAQHNWPAGSLSRPQATFVTRLQPARLSARAARQLPDQSTTLRVDSSSTGDPRLRGALPKADIGGFGGRVIRPIAAQAWFDSPALPHPG
jgi:DNA-binding transcriptional LysR family regulator